MGKVYPCIEVDIPKITHNVSEIVTMCNKKHIAVNAVTKVFCAQEPIVQAFLEAGITQIADSRILNLKKIENLNCQKLLLRIPMLSEVESVVKYSDISLNSELITIRQLSRTAKKLNKIHYIILMIELGDLREGVLVEDVMDTIREIVKLDHIQLIGLGTNVTCYGGVIPDQNNLGKLSQLKSQIEATFNIKLPFISGGNSSSLYMVMNNTIPEGINQLRIGEAIVLGRETSYGKPIPNCYNDAFIFKGQIVEVKNKPTVPKGTIGLNAFGQMLRYENKGIRKRAIVAVGRQDIRLEGLIPLDKDIGIFGASSDHLIIDITDCKRDFQVGDIVSFKVDYGCLLLAMTSPYVEKYYRNE